MLGGTFGFLFASSVVSTIITWSPTDKQAALVLSNGNLTVASSSSYATGRATLGKSSGKWYWEITVGNITTNDHRMFFIGIALSTATLAIVGYNMTGSYGYTDAATANPVGVYGCLLDLTTNTFTVKKNNATWASAGLRKDNDTVVGSDSITAGTWYPTITPYLTDPFTANFGATAFTYAVPSGFTAFNG